MMGFRPCAAVYLLRRLGRLSVVSLSGVLQNDSSDTFACCFRCGAVVSFWVLLCRYSRFSSIFLGAVLNHSLAWARTVGFLPSALTFEGAAPG
jgi:hypothetical protein